MQIKETLSADEVGKLEDVLPEFRRLHKKLREEKEAKPQK